MFSTITALADSIVINTNNSGVSGSYQDKEFDVSGVTFKFTQWMKNTNIQAKKSTVNSVYNIDAIPGTITSIVVVQTGTARAITIYGGTTEKPTTQITSPSTALTMTFDFSGKDYSFFSLTTPGNACYFESITINYTASGGGETPTFATLPFTYDEGSSGIASEDGLSQSGLGSDYGSSPKLKFDGTGDYVILQFSERPGVLTFDIKGNSFSGGTFKVQASADGSAYSDIASYTTLSSSPETKTINDLSEGIRYIKWIYTSKSSGNVALGKINLAKYAAPAPSITIDPDTVIASTSESEGSLSIGFSGLTISDASDFAIQYYNAEDDEITEPDWIITDISDIGGGDYSLSYSIKENSGATRSTYLKVYALGDEDYVYSNLVTFSQNGIPLSYATLPFSFNGGKTDIDDKDGLSHTGLGSDYSVVNTKLKFDSAGDNLILKINENPGALSFNIKGNGFSGGTFKVQVSSDGVSYSDVATYTTLEGGEEEKSINDLASNVRYIKWVYTTRSSGNVGLGNINLTKPAVNPETIDITASLNNGFYWATFYNGESRYNLPEGAQAFTLNASKQLYILGTDGSVIPAGTAVIIKADSAAITLTKSDDASSISVNGGANILVGADAPTPTYSVVGTPYVLGVSGGTLGYYKYTGTGIPAGKAYYIVNE